MPLAASAADIIDVPDGVPLLDTLQVENVFLHTDGLYAGTKCVI